MTEPTLGAMIRRARHRAKMSLKELAQRRDIGSAFLSDVEHGRRTPSRAMLRRIWREVSGMNSDLILWEQARIEQLVAAYREKVEAQ